jgi:hypothetical protein
VKDHHVASTGLKIKFYTSDHTVSIAGVRYSLFSITADHPALSGLTKNQIFDLAYRLGGEARSYQYQIMLNSITKNQMI